MLETMIQTNSTPYDFIDVKKLELVGYESLANGGDQWGMGYLLVVDIFQYIHQLNNMQFQPIFLHSSESRSHCT